MTERLSAAERAALSRAWKLLIVYAAILTIARTALAWQPPSALSQLPNHYLAVINQAGEVWARTVQFFNQSIGPGFKLDGPSLFEWHDGQFAEGAGPNIVMVTRSGAVWNHKLLTDTTIAGGVREAGNLFSGSDSKFVFRINDGASLVVNAAGEVWVHQAGSLDHGIKLKVRQYLDIQTTNM